MELYTVLVAEVLPVVMERLDETPKPEDVKAGWVGFGVFLALCVAVGLLGWAMSRQLRRTNANRKTGAFGPYTEPRADNRIPSGDAHADSTADAQAGPVRPTPDPSTGTEPGGDEPQRPPV